MDPNINLPEVLRLHGLHLAGDPAGRRAVFARADLRGADLRGACLAGADLTLATLAGADLSWADLRGTSLRGADLRGADLRGAQLNGVRLLGAVMDGAMGLLIAEDAQQRLKAVAAEVLANPDSLDMRSWHGDCGTTHCLAGWAIHQAGPLGKILEGLHGPAIAGRLLLGHEAADQFCKSDEEVLDWLETI